MLSSVVYKLLCRFSADLCAGAIMSSIYDEKKDEDGFLYVTYSGENTFGDQISL